MIQQISVAFKTTKTGKLKQLYIFFGYSRLYRYEIYSKKKIFGFDILKSKYLDVGFSEKSRRDVYHTWIGRGGKGVLIRREIVTHP